MPDIQPPMAAMPTTKVSRKRNRIARVLFAELERKLENLDRFDDQRPINL